MRRQLLLFVSLICFLSTAQGQDPVFSQFYAAPLQLNPAFAGVTYAPRVTLNYRNQWPSLNNAYTTYAVAYEQTLEQLNSGIGLMAMADNAGDGIYKTNRFSAVYGYKVQVNNGLAVKIGIEAGIIQSSVDWDRLIFEDQIDAINGPIDPAGNPYESNELRPDNLTNTKFDASAGLLVYGGNFYGGVAFKHLNTPDESLLQVNDNLNVGLPMRTTIHGGAEFNLFGDNNRGAPAFISPNVMYIKQADFKQINAGAYAGFGRVYAGVWYRHTFGNADAAIALVGFKEGILRIGYSYDMTVSRLAQYNSGGAHEISLSINFDESESVKRKRRNSRYLDCFKMFN